MSALDAAVRDLARRSGFPVADDEHVVVHVESGDYEWSDVTLGTIVSIAVYCGEFKAEYLDEMVIEGATAMGKLFADLTNAERGQ